MKYLFYRPVNPFQGSWINVQNIVFLLLFFIITPQLYAQSPLCESYPTTFCCEYVSEVSINGVTRAGAPDETGFTSGPGYFDYTSTSITTLTAGSSYPVSVTVKTNNNYQEFVKIWFDFNGNGVLSDPGELVFDQVHTFSGTHIYSGNITVPATAFNGDIYIRVVMVFANSPALCGSYSFGTTIDLKATITGGVTPYPLNVSISGEGGYIGNVTSSPSGIDTNSGLNSANFAESSTVELTASPTGSAVFKNWSGDITGTDNPISVTMNSGKNVVANFGSPNTPPVANNDSYSRFYTDTGVSFTVPASGVLANDTDADSDPLTVGTPRPASGVSSGSLLTFNADGSFTYTSNNGFRDGSDSFTYYAYDGTVNSNSTATVTLNVVTPRFVGPGIDFNDGNNWNTGYAPTESGLDIIIADGEHINFNQSYTCGNLTFESAASSFSCTSPNTLTITGNVYDGSGKMAIEVTSSLVVRSSIEIPQSTSIPN